MNKKNKIVHYVSSGILILYLLIALLSSFIAGDRPIICLKDGKITFPLLNATTGMSSADHSVCLMPLIPYAVNTIDPQFKMGISPLDHRQSGMIRYRHWMGTDKLGRDVTSGMIHGTEVALKIGFLSVFFSFLFGVSLGLAAGYYQDTTLKAGLIQMIVTIMIVLIGMYYMWMELLVFRYQLFLFFLGCIFLLCLIILINKLFHKYNTSKRYPIPLDLLIVKMIEIRKSFPGVFLLLALISIFSVPSVWNIVLIITILGWADFARLARGETIALKNENYITTARVLGFGSKKIIFRHILPNIMPTLIVAICFSIGSAILLESTLSFLGVGLPVEEVSWGKMMAEGRNLKYWWLVVFPGLAILILIMALNSVASRWQKANFTLFS